jgi:hypothetical protein
MGNELIKASRLQVSLQYPDSIPASVVSKAIIPAATRIITELARSSISVTGAVVEILEETKVKIKFYQEYGRILREDIIPIVAMNKAHHDGRRMVWGMGLDSDLEQDALDDLEAKRQKRRPRI